MIDAEGSEMFYPGSFGYAIAQDCGGHCLADVYRIPGHVEAYITSSIAPLGTVGEGFSSVSHLFKSKTEWPPTSVLKSNRVHCGFKISQYPILVKRLVEAKTPEILYYDDYDVENYIFPI